MTRPTRAALLASAPLSVQRRNAPPVAPVAPPAPAKRPGRGSARPVTPGALPGALDAAAGHRRAAGAARTSGASLESWLAAEHDAMRATGLADVVKVGPPSEVTRVGRRILYVATGSAPPDYLGTLAGGRAVVIEAKRRPGRLHRDRRQVVDGVRRECRDGIEDHQREALAAWERLGALALVVVEFRRAAGVTRHAVPWSALESLWAGDGGARSVGPKELAAWTIGEGAYLARWAETMGGEGDDERRGGPDAGAGR